MTRRAIALLKETQATRVLGDCRGMESGPSLGAVYWLVNDYDGCGVPRQTRIAVVQDDSPRATEFGQFYETVCLNRQYQAKMFYSPEDAEAWLLSGSSA